MLESIKMAYANFVNVIAIILILIGSYGISYTLFSRICAQHRKVFYRILAVFIILALIVGIRNYPVMILMSVLYYAICFVIYFVCERGSGIPHSHDKDTEHIREPPEE